MARLSVAGSEANKGRECVLVFWLSTEHFNTLKTDVEVEFLQGHNGLVFLSYEDPLVLFIVTLIGTDWLDEIRRTNRLCITTAPQNQ